MTDPQSLNHYAYLRNWPITGTDSLGLDDDDDFYFDISRGGGFDYSWSYGGYSSGPYGGYGYSQDMNGINAYISWNALPSMGPTSYTGLQLDYLANGSYDPRAMGSLSFSASSSPEAPSNTCSVPTAPLGISANRNIKFANVLHVFGVLNMPVFYGLVHGKGPMDYKQLAQNYSDGHPIGSPYAEFGNFNYGAVGAAFGIPQSILLRAAGLAQKQADTSTPEWGNWKGGPPYGDDPKDQAQIMAGYNYYQAACDKHD